MKRLALLALATIPGAVHVLLGRTGSGLLLMAVGFVAWEFVYLGLVGLWQGSAFGHVMALVAGISTLVISWWWTWNETSVSRTRRREQATLAALRDAQRAFLRRQLGEAQQVVTSGLRYSRNDIDLLFLGWRIALERHDHALARSLARRLRRADDAGKWLWQLEQEEARYEQA